MGKWKTILVGVDGSPGSRNALKGLGASEGQRLGSVPSAVVRDAVCDVLVVQTSAPDEDRLFGRQPAEADADGSRSGTGAEPGGSSRR
jgi:maltose/moltooligosaccharide transporter